MAKTLGESAAAGVSKPLGLPALAMRLFGEFGVGTERRKNSLSAGIVDRCVEAGAGAEKMSERIVQRRRKRFARGRRLKDGVPEIRHLIFLRMSCLDALGPDECAPRHFVSGGEIVPFSAAGEGGAATFACAAERAGQIGAVAGPGGKQFAPPDDEPIHLCVDLSHGAAMEHADDDALGFLIRTDKF